MLLTISYIVFFFALVASIGYGLNLIMNVLMLLKADELQVALLELEDTSLLKGYKVMIVCLLWTAYLILTNVQ